MAVKRKKPASGKTEHAHPVASLFSSDSKFHVDYTHVTAAPALPTNVKREPRRPPVAERGAASSSDGGTGTDEEEDEDEGPSAVRPSPSPQAKRGKAPPSKDDLLASLKDDALDRTVFVGNLAETTTKKRLKQHFQPHGEIESIRFRSMLLKKDSRVPRRVAAAAGTIDGERGSHHAYVVFVDKSSVANALRENMRVLDDRHIRVDRAAVNTMRVKLLGSKKGSRAVAELVGSSHQVQYDVSKTVFVGNLPLDIEDEELVRFFIAGLGSGSESLLQAVRVIRDPKTSVGKGIAFVLFKSRGARKQALGLNGKALQGRRLRISEAQAEGTSEPNRYVHQGRHADKSKSWQGATSSKSGRVRGGVDAKKGTASQKYATTLRKSKKVQKPKRTGKRPAVLARKRAAKAAKAAGGAR
jgi:nucleolar protein 12